MATTKAVAEMDGGALNSREVDSRQVESRQADVNIGELLIAQGKLTHDDVGKVLALARRTQLRFGEAAIKLGLLSEDDLLTVLSQQFSYPVLTPGSSSLNAALKVAYEPFSSDAETFRRLRSQLRLRWFNNERRVLTVCSTAENDGCSITAANLAICFAQLGERTLLIDCDMRKPAQRSLFGLPHGPGVSNLLAGRCSMREAVVSIDTIKGLALLGAGPTPPNPQELLSKHLFRELVLKLATLYSVVIIDTPPAESSADIQTIAAVSGGALLVARRHHTRLDNLQRLQDQLSPGGIEIVGAVITD